MKTFIQTLFTFSFLLFTFTSCEDNAQLTKLSIVSFSAPIEATPNSIELSKDTNFEPVISVSWLDVEFPINAPVTYTLAIDVAADTFGDNGWANSIRIPTGEDVLSTSLLGINLNEYAANLGLLPDLEGELVLRVEAYMDRYVYSEPITIQVTPYVDEIVFGEIYLPGSYNGWDPTTASKLSAIDTGIYQGYLTVNSPDGLVFKITPEQNWGEFYGLDVNGNLALGADGDLSLPDFGSYQITVNLNTLSYTIVPYSWGVIGNATPAGWDADTDMSYDYSTSTWKFTGNLVLGALKFRLNNQWTINYGTEDGNSGNVVDAVMYLDNPGAHNIIEAGNYEVIFSINPITSDTITYSVTKL